VQLLKTRVFSQLTVEELSRVSITLDILTPPEPVSSREELDPKKFGVIVQSGWRKGLLLPDLEGVNSVDEQIRIACKKAGIGTHEPIELFRFRVERYEENREGEKGEIS